MRATLAILSLPLLSLAACGGGGAGTQSLGSIAPPISGGTVAGGGLVSVTPAPTPTPTSFLDVATTTDFASVGAFQSVIIANSTDANGVPRSLTTYQGNASTAGTPSGTITFNPRDGIFTVAIADARAGVTRSVNFQDPIHRIDFTPGRTPINDVPNYTTFNYLKVDAADGSNDTFFYERPGNVGKFVTLAGFVHYSTPTPETPYQSDHGAMVFGSKTSTLQIPASGIGHFEGDFLATMISSGSRDTASFGTFLQWINGASTVDVDFGKATLALGLSGVVGQAYRNGTLVSDVALATPTGTTFAATGAASLSNFNTAFAGKFLSASLTSSGVRTAIDLAPISAGSSTAGASSIDGAFYGPNAVDVGGNFRITGGVPDQRLDILGAFVGTKK